jgi:hypothetical protein
MRLFYNPVTRERMAGLGFFPAGLALPYTR